MKLRNKKTGEIKEWQRVGAIDYGELNEVYDSAEYNSLAELNEVWEDYKPVEPIFDEKIRRGIRAWWDMQDNPFKSASIMLKSRDKDLDGFYHWKSSLIYATEKKKYQQTWSSGLSIYTVTTLTMTIQKKNSAEKRKNECAKSKSMDTKS